MRRLCEYDQDYLQALSDLKLKALDSMFHRGMVRDLIQKASSLKSRFPPKLTTENTKTDSDTFLVPHAACCQPAFDGPDRSR